MKESVVEYYSNSFSEHDRHLDGFGQIQRLRTLQIFQQHIQPKQKIIDIGGATGAYSFDLAKQEHEVHLLDLVPVHIEKAKKVGEEIGVSLGGYYVGDAQSLQFEDNSFDVAILHGPLYHITDHSQRVKVLTEALRILKPNGKVFAFAINRYAGVFYGIQSELILDDSYFDMIKKEVETGYRDRAPSWHFHLPEEMEREVSKAGFHHIQTKGVVSPVWMLPDVEAKLADLKIQRQIVSVSELLENEPIIGQDFVTIGSKL